MSSGITISGCLLQQPVRDGRLGTWHLAAAPGGEPAGVLLVRPDADVDRLAASTTALIATGATGVLRVRDLVSKHGRVWLVVNDAPAPTLADVLAGGSQGAGGAMRLLAALGDTLLALHGHGSAHGDVSPTTIVIRPGGAPLLADWGAVAAPGAAADAAGWAAVARTLATAWCAGDPAAAALLHRVAGLAATAGDLGAAVAELHTGIAAQQANWDSATMVGQQPLAAALRFAARPADPEVVLGSGATPDSGGSVLPDPGRSLLPGAPSDSPEGMAGTELDSEPAAAAAAAVAAASVPGASAPPSPSPASLPAPSPAASSGSGSRSSGASGASGSMPGTVSRFGPGLPASGAQRAWRRGARPASRPATGKFARYAKAVGSLLVLVVIAAAVLWWTQRSAVDVTGVEVRVEAAGGCGGTTRIVGVISTNGEPGRISFRWVRSDTGPGPLLQQTVGTEKETRVALEWTVKGQGTLTARAELEILDPRPLKGSGQFTYACE